MLELEETMTSPTLIKVVGVGGGGMNAVNRMIDAGLKGVEFIVINTDEQVLKKSITQNKIQIGQRTTRGMGAGGDPDVGYRAAMEDKETIARVLQGADMVFITAGMGGGTGTGAAPIIAEVAREMGALTVGVVTLPFEVEGRRRRELARQGIEVLRGKVDTLLTIRNESLFKVIDPSTSVNVAFRMVDEILLNAVRGISDLINTAGIVNVDFADVRSIMNETGDAIMGAGEGIGESRVSDAVEQAIHNVLLEESDFEGATALLINVCGGEDMSITEWRNVSEIVTEKADPQANIIIGLTVDDSMRNRMRVTVIATGFRKKQAGRERNEVRAAVGGNSSWKNYPHEEKPSRMENNAQAQSPFQPIRQVESQIDHIPRSRREENYRESFSGRQGRSSQSHGETAEPYSIEESPAFIRKKYAISSFDAEESARHIEKKSPEKELDTGDLEIPAFLRQKFKDVK